MTKRNWPCCRSQLSALSNCDTFPAAARAGVGSEGEVLLWIRGRCFALDQRERFCFGSEGGGGGGGVASDQRVRFYFGSEGEVLLWIRG